MSTPSRTLRRQATALAAVAVLATTAGCSTKASSSSAPAGGGSSSAASAATVKTGPGIVGTTITLGELTDLTGVFAALGKDITNSQQVYFDQLNAKGGICGKYQVKLSVKDHGYVVANAVQLYSSLKDESLALTQTIGSAINIALADKLQSDQLVNIPQAWAASLTDNPNNALPGATYQIEMINGIDYLLSKGLIKDGDTVGHIYHEGEYGAGGLAGSKYVASKHNLKLVEEKIKPTDSDLTAQVTDLKSKGVKAIFLTDTPSQTAAVVGVAAAQGLNVPVLGNNPTFAPALLKTPVAAALKANFYAASPVVAFDSTKGTEVKAAFDAKYPGQNASLGVLVGWADGLIMTRILEKACANGDLTRAGVVAAKQSLSTVETDGLTGTLDYSAKGVSPSTTSFIFRAADVPGGASTVTPTAYKGDDVAGYSRTP